MNHTKKLVIMALLIAMSIVLTRLLMIEPTPAIRISFGFAPIVLMAMLFKPAYAGIGAAVADVVGFFIFRPAGTFFPGFTLTAFLMGVTYWAFLRNYPVKMWRVCAAALIVTIGLNLILDTIWLTIILREGVVALIPQRVIRTAVMLPIQVVTIRFLVSERFRAILPMHKKQHKHESFTFVPPSLDMELE